MKTLNRDVREAENVRDRERHSANKASGTEQTHESTLADAVDLQWQMKQAHWNVKGPHFIGLHELFDQVDEAVESYVDMIAERIVQLGGIAEGTARVAASRSQLEEYPLDTADLFTEVSRGIDKWLWFVEAHTQAPK